MCHFGFTSAIVAAWSVVGAAACSFLLTSRDASNFSLANKRMRRRGPDATVCEFVADNFTLCHNLLSMSEQRILQPMRSENGLFALFNGEIYNFQNLAHRDNLSYKGDSEVILPTYLRYGNIFSRHFLGEFAIAVLDLPQSRAVVSTDVFGTKPLWYSLHDGFHVATYKSALIGLGLPSASVRPVPPNTIMSFELPGRRETTEVRVQSRRAVFEFDLYQHRKLASGSWAHEFERAVHRRAKHGKHGFFIGLSAGHDSGGIHSALLAMGLPHTAYSILGKENMEVLQERIALGVCNSGMTQASVVLQLSKDALLQEQEWADLNVEEARYMHARTTNLQDGATLGVSSIARNARRRGHFVFMSGTGADEILSDYGDRGLPVHIKLGSFWGWFPDDLFTIFPWKNFYLHMQRDYLNKEEAAAGAHGIESRYPFLDPRVVQEFLWTFAADKNLNYKAPLHDYMTRRAYPFKYVPASFKVGFFPASNTILGPAEMFTTLLRDQCTQLEGGFAERWQSVVRRQAESMRVVLWGRKLVSASTRGMVEKLGREIRSLCSQTNRTISDTSDCIASSVLAAEAISGITAISAAAYAGHVDTVRWLLESAGCPSIKCSNWIARLNTSAIAASTSPSDGEAIGNLLRFYTTGTLNFARTALLTPSDPSASRQNREEQSLTIHVVYASNEAAFDGLLLSMISLTLNARRPHQLVIHILVRAAARQAAIEVLQHFNVELATVKRPRVVLHNIELDSMPSVQTMIDRHGFSGWGVQDHYSMRSPRLVEESFCRFHLPEYLHNISRAIWVDVDTIVQDDVFMLFNMSMQHVLAAVPEGSLLVIREEMAKATKSHKHYDAFGQINEHDMMFNAGILLIDLDKWRAGQFTRRLYDMVDALGGFGITQLPLNLVFRNYDILDRRWNTMHLGYDCGIPESNISGAGILHWTGPNKPWNHDGARAFSARCWNHLAAPYAPRVWWTRRKRNWTSSKMWHGDHVARTRMLTAF